MAWKEVLKAKSASQKKLERARKTMKRKGLEGFNKPKRVQGKKHSHIVMAKVGNKTKLIPFGQAGVKTNQTAGQRRQFKLRHAKNIARGKMSAAYWADKVKWNPRKTKEKKNKNWRKGS